MASGKYILNSYPLIASCAINSTALIYSRPVNLINLDNVAFQFKWTGTPRGNFFIDRSVDHQEDMLGNIITQGNWYAIGSTSVAQALASSGLFQTDGTPYQQTPYPWMRVRYEPSTGATTGVLNVWATAKQI